MADEEYALDCDGRRILPVDRWRRTLDDVLDGEWVALEEEDNWFVARERARELSFLERPSSSRWEHATRIAGSDEARVEHHNWRDYQGGTLTVSEWQILKIAYGGCAYCGAKGKLTLEHVKPLSRGGRTAFRNVVPACWACNKEKGTSTPEEWLHGDRLEAFRRRQQEAAQRMKNLRSRAGQ
jgi:5-methylcytosine-specific restriction endonuclease McrA